VARGESSRQPANFEYRVFAPRLDGVARRLAREAVAEQGRDSAVDLYLVGRRTDRSVKVRGGCIEVKALRERRGELERWEPVVRRRLPLGGAWVRDVLAEHLGIVLRARRRDRYPLLALLTEIAAPEPQVRDVCVEKHRRRFSRDGARAELTRVAIDGRPFATAAVESGVGVGALDGGRPFATAAVESADADAAWAFVRRLGLDRWPNESFVRRLRPSISRRPPARTPPDSTSTPQGWKEDR